MANKGTKILELVIGVVGLIWTANSAKKDGKKIIDAWNDLKKA